MSQPTYEVAPLQERLDVLLGVLVVAMVATPILFRGLAQAAPALAEHPAFMSAGLLVQQSVLLGLTIWRLKRAGSSWGALRPFIESIQQLGAGLWWGMGLLFLNGLLAQFSLWVLGNAVGAEATAGLLSREQSAVGTLLNPDAHPLYLGAVVFLAVGLAPIVEESFFRGYAYPVLKHYVKGHAVWLSALLFAGVHLYVINFLPVFALGILLTLIYERTGSLAIPIVAHAAVNALVAIAAVLVGST